MRRELILITVLAAAALAVRIVPAWSAVYGEGAVDFLETDAWYHVRLLENQVRHFPWRVTLDPFAAPGGQFVPIAPLYGTLTSTLVVLSHGRQADTVAIEQVAALVPPVLGALAVVVVWALGRRLFGSRAGLLSAALLTILPGHFLDRTTLGFVDHHALEALLALATLLAVVRALQMPSAAARATAGVTLGLYLLAWASGAFLAGIFGLWLVLLIPIASRARDVRDSADVAVVAGLVALALVVAFQDPRMHRYGSQVVGLAGLAGLGLLLRRLSGEDRNVRGRVQALGLLAAAGLLAALAVWWRRPDLVSELVTDVARLTPDPARMGVLEARPLFLYSGGWRWEQPWDFFRSGFFIGIAALVPLGVRIWRRRQPADLLVWLFVAAMFAATVGQNRFGYYLMPACALVGGWFIDRVMAWGGSPAAPDRASRGPVRLWRELTALAVVAATFGPCLSPELLLRPRSSRLTSYWRDTMDWLRDRTPPPFPATSDESAEYYLARYPREHVPEPAYAVMTWWDQGYWVIQRARRVPVSNPTQARAPNAAAFYVETDNARALEILRREGADYVVADWELPFRNQDETIMGRFQNVLDWSGAAHHDYYEVYYRRAGRSWTPVWVFHEPYYRSMAFRLVARGGDAAVPAHTTTVMTIADRIDGSGRAFREVLAEQTYATFEAAQAAAASQPPATTRIVGLDPWRAAFPVERVRGLRRVFEARTPEQSVTESPWVRIYRVER